jgi:hypothetical protein
MPLRLDVEHRGVTDGEHFFPLVRPSRSQWRYSKIRFSMGITAGNWPLFLKAIIGLPVNEVVDLKKTKARMGLIKRQQRDAERRRRVGQCFTGHRAVCSVSVGENLVFTLQRADKLIYVVDSPEYARALYVFDDYGDAHAWASRAVNWREARKRARCVQIHRGNWKERTELALV